jgi:hypothetical protein
MLWLFLEHSQQVTLKGTFGKCFNTGGGAGTENEGVGGGAAAGVGVGFDGAGNGVDVDIVGKVKQVMVGQMSFMDQAKETKAIHLVVTVEDFRREETGAGSSPSLSFRISALQRCCTAFLVLFAGNEESDGTVGANDRVGASGIVSSGVGSSCSVSRWRPQKVDKRMVLEYTHGLFIT